MATRIISVILLLISILFLPFWLSVIFALVLVFYFTFFMEAVVLFLVSDMLFGVDIAKFWGVTLVSFFAALILVSAIEISKKHLKFYQDRR